MKFKKILNFLFLIIFTFNLFFCSNGNTKINAINDKNKMQTNVNDVKDENFPRIIFLGDSLTAGYGLQVKDSPPSLIEEKIKFNNLNFKVINAGRSGDTTAGGLERIDWLLKNNLNTKLLVIGLGSNDAMRGYKLNDIEKNLKAIIDKVQKFDSKIKILLWEMYTFESIGQGYSKAYNKIFYKVAKNKKIILIPFPLKNVAKNMKYNQEDGIHPNAEGAKILAENIWIILSKYL